MRGGQSHESSNNANSSMSYQGGAGAKNHGGMSGPDMQYQGPLRNDQKFS